MQAPTHAPCSHFCPEGHAWPQSPQFAASAVTSRQSLAQTFSPVGHTQAPALHPWPEAGHAFRHAPQLAAVCCESMQMPPKQRSPRPPQEHAPPTHSRPGAQKLQAAELAPTHVPSLHDSDDAQAWPHAPQFPGSRRVSVQAAPQDTRGESQAAPTRQVSEAESQRMEPGHRP